MGGGGRAKFAENVRASAFNKDLSNETTFSMISISLKKKHFLMPKMFYMFNGVPYITIRINNITSLLHSIHYLNCFFIVVFAGVIRRHRLQYNPNLCEEGVRGRLDPHGLVLVLACGTLHNHQTVCGVFEQVFFSFKWTQSKQLFSKQRCGSRAGSGSVCFWIFLWSSKLVRKTLIPTVLWLLYFFASLKNYFNGAWKIKKQKTNVLLSWRSLTKTPGSWSVVGSGSESRSGSVSRRYGTADPDPYQNVTYPDDTEGIEKI
jgi:hypothetical protein